MQPIKVLLVEDSLVALAILKRLFMNTPDIEVVGTARDGEEALALVPCLKPNVICTDLKMRGMDGLTFTKRVMTQYPTPILVISNSVHPEDGQQIFELLQAGAVDVFPKPIAGTLDTYQQVQHDLTTKIRVLAGVKVFARRNSERSVSFLQSRIQRIGSPPEPQLILPSLLTEDALGGIRAIAIGSSTGGPQALYQVLSGLAPKLTVPVICTQHISPGFLLGLVSWLNIQCRLPVKIAEMGEIPQPGTVYFAPEGRHLGINQKGQLMDLNLPPIEGHCPSVTAMFESLVQFYGRYLAGVLLTGMGRDGAIGLRKIAQYQGLTIAQDEQTCVVFGMPKAAIDLRAAQVVLPVDQIASFLLPKLRHRVTTV